MRQFKFHFFTVLTMTLLALSATAYNFKVDGIYYYYNSYGNEVIVTDADFNTNTPDYTGHVAIPETVTYNGTTYSVISIDSEAFYNCSSLYSITIPNSVRHIGDKAFYKCSSLTIVTIPNSVKNIGEQAFLSSGITSVTIGNSVTTIGNYAFYHCQELTSVTLGNSVTTIGDYAFYDCTGLTSIDIPNSVTTIGNGAFENCWLTSVTIPNSVTSINDEAFCNCSLMTSITIPNSVRHIGDKAFYYCSRLTRIDIPNSVISIGDNAFCYCTGLTSVTIPNSVTSIADGAFANCSGLTSITIPNSVTSIGNYAFLCCTGLNDVYSFIDDPSIVSMGFGVFDSNTENHERTLHVPVGTVLAYQANRKWSDYFSSIVEMEPDPVLAISIELNETECEITEGETLQLTATVIPEDVTDRTVSWTTSNENVATVDENGLVTAETLGTATITATTNDGSNLSASCNVTVLKRIVLAESIKLNVTTAGLNEGSTLQLTATVLPEDCDNKTVLWSSDNPSVATIDSNGLVTTHSVGTATITAMTTDGSNLSTTCTVTLLPISVKGDVNGDNSISISDVTKLIDYLLSGTWN